MAIAYGDPLLFNLGLLLIRLIFGLVMVAHGAQKLFGWFGGYGLAGTGGFVSARRAHLSELAAEWEPGTGADVSDYLRDAVRDLIPDARRAS